MTCAKKCVKRAGHLDMTDDTKTVWVDGKDTPLEAFDCSVAWNSKAMTRFVRALVMNRGYFTDSFTFSRPPHGRNDTTVFRVFLPKTRVEEFKASALPQDFRPPPEVHLNSTSVECDYQNVNSCARCSRECTIRLPPPPRLSKHSENCPGYLCVKGIEPCSEVILTSCAKHGHSPSCACSQCTKSGCMFIYPWPVNKRVCPNCHGSGLCHEFNAGDGKTCGTCFGDKLIPIED